LATNRVTNAVTNAKVPVTNAERTANAYATWLQLGFESQAHQGFSYSPADMSHPLVRAITGTE
jgi:hypothetical protein